MWGDDVKRVKRVLVFLLFAAAVSGVVRDTSSNTVVNDARDTATATTGITATTNNPAGGVASIDNRPAFVKVIFCKKD